MSEDLTQGPNTFQIHQGSYLNARLNRLLENIDLFSSAPLTMNQQYNILNYKLLIQNLCSVGITIYGEVSIEEKEKIKYAITQLEAHSKLEIFKDENQNVNGPTKPRLKLLNSIWGKINSDILECRLYFSELLEKYGLGLSFEKSAKQEMLE